MEKLVELLFPQLGRVVLGAVILSAVVWGFAHYNAAPSTQVSVLWGLVEYTKGEEKSDAYVDWGGLSSESMNGSEDNGSDTDGSNEVNTPPSVSIKSWFSLSKNQAEDLSVRMRTERHLRPLQPLETGLPISSLSDGVYAFYQINDIPEASDSAQRFWGGLSAIQESSLFIEVQSLESSNVFFVAYVVESQAIDVAKLTGVKEISISVSPVFWRDFDSRIEIPMNRIVRGDTRRITHSDGEIRLIWDLTLK